MAENDPTLPQRLQRWADGRSTLKEVRGYTDEELYAIARMGYFFFYQGKLEEARTVFQGLYAVNPLDGYSARALAVVEMASGNSTGAMAAYDVALKISPEDAEALLGRAEVRLSLGDRGGAAEDLRRAVRAAGVSPPVEKKARAMLSTIGRR